MRKGFALLLAALLALLPACAPAETATEATAPDEALRGIGWDADRDAVHEAEGGQAYARAVVVPGGDLLLYGQAVSTLTYRFDEAGRMTSRQYLMRYTGAGIFSSLVYSLFLRYGMPLSAEDRLAVWQAGALGVTLSGGDETTITYTWTGGHP